MSEPWEDYQSKEETPPWEDYSAGEPVLGKDFAENDKAYLPSGKAATYINNRWAADEDVLSVVDPSTRIFSLSDSIKTDDEALKALNSLSPQYDIVRGKTYTPDGFFSTPKIGVHPATEELSQGKPPSIWNSVFGMFDDPHKEAAKATNALVMSDLLNKYGANISPSFAYDHFDEIERNIGVLKEPMPIAKYLNILMTPVDNDEMKARITKDITAYDSDLSAAWKATKEFWAMGVPAKSAFALAAGTIAFPIQIMNAQMHLQAGNPQPAADIIKGLVDFIGRPTFLKDFARAWVEEGKLVPEKFKEAERAWSTDPIGSAMAIVPFLKGGLKTFVDTAKPIVEAVTKNVITQYNLPKTITVNATDLRTELQLQEGGVVPTQTMEMIKEIGITKEMLKDGVTLEIPAEKIIINQDKPWFAKVKNLFNIEPYQEAIIEYAGKVKKGKPVAGLLEGTGKDPIAEKVFSKEPITEAPKPTTEQVKQSQEEYISKLFEKDMSDEEVLKAIDAMPESEFSKGLEEASTEHLDIIDETTKWRAKHDEIFSKDIDTLTSEEAKYHLTHDELTGLQNRKAFDKDIKEVTGLADLDGFKSINDNIDHLTGNKYLKALGQEIHKEGIYDYVYRWGGDEFGIKALDEKHAKEIIQKFDNALQNVGILVELEGEKFLLVGGGFSHGIGQGKGTEALKLADTALYKNKEDRTRSGDRIKGSFPKGLNFIPETAWETWTWSEVQSHLAERHKQKLTFLRDYLAIKEGVVKLKDSKGNVVSRSKSDREQVFQDLSDTYGYSYAQIQKILDRAIQGKQLIDKPRTPASLEKAQQFITDILEKTTDMFEKANEGFLTPTEEKMSKSKPLQQDMTGAKTGLENKLPSEEIKGKTALEQATEDAKIREALKGQQEITLESGGLQTIYENLMQKAKVPETAYSDLVELGKYVYEKGATTSGTWMKGMKEHLGKLWDTFKEYLLKVWNDVKAFNEKLGQKGSVGKEKAGDIKLSEIDKQEEIFKVGMLEAYKAGREAYKAGNKAGVETEHARMVEMQAKKKAMSAMRENVRDIIKDLRKVSDKVSKYAPEAADPINSLLENIDFTKLSEAKRIELTSIKEYLGSNPEVELSQKIMDAVARLDKTAARDLTYDDLLSLHTAVIHYAQLNKNIQEIRVGNEKMRQTDVLEKSIAEMKPLAKIETELKGSLSQKEISKLKNKNLVKSVFGIRQDHYDLIIEKLAGPLSTMDKVLYRGVKEGILTRLKYRQDVFDKFQADIGGANNFTAKYGIKNLFDWFDEKVKIGDTMPLTRGERMALYRHSLNPQNLYHLTAENGGFGMKHSENPNEVFKITLKEIDSIVESLTPAELEYASKPIDNLFNAQGDSLESVFLEKNGYRMPRVIENYYPIEVMSEALGKDKETADAIDKFKDRFIRIGIDKGMLEERIKSNKPIYLNSINADINKSVEKASAYIGLEIPLSHASRLLYDNSFRSELKTRYGEVVFKEIEQGLKDIAGNWKTFTDVEQFVMKGKNAVTTAMLGLPNPFPPLAQALSSLPLFMEYVRPAYIIDGMMDFFINGKEMIEKHKLYSPEFRDRISGGTFNYDIADVFKETAEFRLVGDKENLKKKLLVGMRYIDSRSIAIGMQGSILQVLDEFKSGKLSNTVKTALDIKDSDIEKLTPEDKIRLAYKYADYATERTQATGLPEHQASFSKGSALERILSMFGADTNTQLSMLRRSYDHAKRTGDWGAYAKTAFLTLFLIPALMTAREKLKEEIYSRNKKSSLVGNFISNQAAMLFIVRDVVNGAVELAEGNYFGADFKTPVQAIPTAAIKLLGYGVKAMTDDTGEKREKAFWQAIDNGLFLLAARHGLPYQSTKKMGKLVLGIEDKKQGGRR